MYQPIFVQVQPENNTFHNCKIITKFLHLIKQVTSHQFKISDHCFPYILRCLANVYKI